MFRFLRPELSAKPIHELTVAELREGAQAWAMEAERYAKLSKMLTAAADNLDHGRPLTWEPDAERAV